jgi:hypothetical protein
MSLILDGTNGLSDVDGTAATPAIRGTDTNTGIFFPAADTIAFSEGGTEVARFNSSGNLQTIGTIGVGGATPSTSGAGITYPATQSASSDANTLDDYEEGTWTPVITALSGTITSFTAFGQYTKIGQLVVAQFQYNITNNGTGAVGIIVNGLPFSGTTNTSGGLAREIAVNGVSGGAYLSGPTGMIIVTAAGAYMGGTGWVVVGTISYQV